MEELAEELDEKAWKVEELYSVIEEIALELGLLEICSFTNSSLPMCPTTHHSSYNPSLRLSLLQLLSQLQRSQLQLRQLQLSQLQLSQLQLSQLQLSQKQNS